MNILQVTLGFYPAVGWGGPVKIVHQNSLELRRRGHGVTVYCSNLLDKTHKIQPGTFEREVDGLRVVYFNTLNLPWWPGTLGPAWAPDLARTLATGARQFDVIHINGYRNPLFIPAARAARKSGIPFVVQPHGAIPVVINSFFIKRVYDRVLKSLEVSGLSALIALQTSERQQALELGIPAERIEVIHNGLPADQSRPSHEPGCFRKKFGLAEGQRVILFLGRINKKKGVDMLVQSFAQMENQDAHLVIAGPDDGQLAEVKRWIGESGLESRVTLTGLLEGADVQAAYQDADLFVLPCRTDTFPTTIMEACQAGTPMVVTDRCEIAPLVGGRVAEVTPFDAAAFANAMQRLLADQELYARYQRNCPAVMADTFSLPAAVDRLESLYERVIAEKKAGRERA